MAFLGQAFDATTVEPDVEFEPVPDGEYLAMIIDSDILDTKNRTGQYLKLTHQIIDGPFNGRYIFCNLNIINSNDTCQRIGQAQLSSVCHATGVLHAIQDSAELHNKPMVIKVEYVPKDEARGFKAKNDIKAWKSADNVPKVAQPVGTAQPAANTAQPAAASAGAAPVWARK